MSNGHPRSESLPRVRPTRLTAVFTTKTYETSFYKSATASLTLYMTGPFEGNGPGKLLNTDLSGLLAIASARQSFLHAAFFTGLKIERVPLDFLNHVLLLDFSFKAAQGVFKRFALLKPDFSQGYVTPPNYRVGLGEFCSVLCPSQGVSCRKHIKMQVSNVSYFETRADFAHRAGRNRRVTEPARLFWPDPSIQFGRIVVQHHMGYFQRPFPGDLAILHHAGQGDRQGFAAGLRSLPANLFPVDLRRVGIQIACRTSLFPDTTPAGRE